MLITQFANTLQKHRRIKAHTPGTLNHWLQYYSSNFICMGSDGLFKIKDEILTPGVIEAALGDSEKLRCQNIAEQVVHTCNGITN